MSLKLRGNNLLQLMDALTSVIGGAKERGLVTCKIILEYLIVHMMTCPLHPLFNHIEGTKTYQANNKQNYYYYIFYFIFSNSYQITNFCVIKLKNNTRFILQSEFMF